MTFNSHKRSPCLPTSESELQIAPVLGPDVLDVVQPVVDQAQSLAVQSSPDAAAAVVPADDDMSNLQHIDGKLHHGQAIEVGMNDHVCDVAMNEKLARQQPDDLVRRHSAVGAADPEIIRRLLARKLEEELRILLPDAVGPGLVVVEKMTQRLHAE